MVSARSHVGVFRSGYQPIPTSRGTKRTPPRQDCPSSSTSSSDSNHCYYVIKKGETIALSHSAVNWDEKIWKNPLHFDTQRDKSLYQNDYNFTTFSHGIHRCPGQSYALTMMVCTVIQLLAGVTMGSAGDDRQSIDDEKQEWSIHLESIGSLPSVSFERATLAQREGPVPITLRPKKQTT